MSTKKYLTLEAAAAQLGIKPEELVRLREKGEVRGFADRGTWKFRSEDIDELARRREPDSSPEVPLIADDDDGSSQPMIITKGRGAGSDSDVRLVPDDKKRAKLSGSSAELLAMGADSDSDVRLVEDPRELQSSDSDVQLVGPKGKGTDSDSDVMLSDSDSDVRLAGAAPSDSDVQLVKRGGKKKSSDSDVSLLPKGGKGKVAVDDAARTDIDSALVEGAGSDLDVDSGIRIAGDSGISLSSPADSGILLEGPSDSPFPQRSEGVTLSGSDSDISFRDDSGITLEPDSGIRIAGDSGVRMDRDSGIRLSDARDSDINLEASDDDLDSAVPLLLGNDDAARTDAEVPLLSESDELETLNIPAPRAKRKGDTSVVIFSEDEGSGTELADEEAEETYGLSGSSVEEEELEVSEDVLGDDEEQLEVFDSDDSVFDESFEEGTSAAELSVIPGRIAVPDEAEWPTSVLSLLTVSTLAMFIGVIIAVDLLRTVWGGGASSVYPGELIGAFGSLFK
jgi:hypothetical protein